MARLRAIVTSHAASVPRSGSNRSARSQSARKVSWTTSLASPLSRVVRIATAKTVLPCRSYSAASASWEPAIVSRTSSTSGVTSPSPSSTTPSMLRYSVLR